MLFAAAAKHNLYREIVEALWAFRCRNVCSVRTIAARGVATDRSDGFKSLTQGDLACIDDVVEQEMPLSKRLPRSL